MGRLGEGIAAREEGVVPVEVEELAEEECVISMSRVVVWGMAVRVDLREVGVRGSVCAATEV